MRRDREMELIEIFLPVRDNAGNAFPFAKFQPVKEELVKEFGGVTAYLTSPGEGVWQESPRSFVKDDVVTFEVMTETTNRDWWKGYKKELEKRFGQEEIVVRKMQIEIL